MHGIFTNALQPVFQARTHGSPSDLTQFLTLFLEEWGGSEKNRLG